MSHENLVTLLQKARVSRTVYALVTKQTSDVFDDLLGSTGSPTRVALHDLYTQPWTQKQDETHGKFINTWQSWVKPAVTLPNNFNIYPTAGASEGIRSVMAEDVAQGKLRRVLTFSGEYEGYTAYATAFGIPVKVLNRDHWQRELTQHQFGAGDVFYLSHPSAIDGNIWSDYDAFMQTLQEKHTRVTVALDLTYVGATTRLPKITADYANISSIFVSLSKPLGVYYHRIGLTLTRQPYGSLLGNKWFKNLLSLELGSRLMQAMDLMFVPTYYAPYQQAACDAVNTELGLNLIPADVFLLGTGPKPANPSPLEQYLIRGDRLRVCLTPRIAHLCDPKITDAVTPRAHEKL